MEAMNIIFVNSSFPRSEAEPIISGEHKNAYYLAKTLSEQGHDITVLTHRAPEPRYSYGDMEVIEVGDGVGKGFVRAIHRSTNEVSPAREVLEEKDIDLIHSHALSTSGALIFLRQRGYIDAPIISTAHGTNLPEIEANLTNIDLKDALYYVNAQVKRFIDTYSWTRSDGVISVSEFQLDEMRDIYGVSDERLTAIPNGVDTEHYKPASGSEIKAEYDLEDKKVVLFVGRLVRKKGIQVLVDAAPEIVAEHPDVAFLLVCGSEEFAHYGEELIEKIRQSPVSDRFTVLQRVPEADLPDYYNAADLLVVPSLNYESIPTVIFEGMACELPVVGTNRWGIPYQLGSEETLIPQGDAGALKREVNELLGDPERRSQLGKQNRERAIAEFDWTKIAGDHEDFYTEVIQ